MNFVPCLAMQNFPRPRSVPGPSLLEIWTRSKQRSWTWGTFFFPFFIRAPPIFLENKLVLVLLTTNNRLHNKLDGLGFPNFIPASRIRIPFLGANNRCWFLRNKTHTLGKKSNPSQQSNPSLPTKRRKQSESGRISTPRRGSQLRASG